MTLQLANLGPEPIGGVLLWAQGSALDQRLIRLDQARSIVVSSGPQGFLQTTAPFQASPRGDGGLGAALEDLVIAGWPALTTSGAAYLATFQAQAGLQIAGLALTRGSGSLVFAAFPLSQIEAGAGPGAEGFEILVSVR